MGELASTWDQLAPSASQQTRLAQLSSTVGRLIFPEGYGIRH
jgi:hypothetical protein